jgi:hypothetical protein
MAHRRWHHDGDAKRLPPFMHAIVAIIAAVAATYVVCAIISWLILIQKMKADDEGIG